MHNVAVGRKCRPPVDDGEVLTKPTYIYYPQSIAKGVAFRTTGAKIRTKMRECGIACLYWAFCGRPIGQIGPMPNYPVCFSLFSFDKIM